MADGYNRYSPFYRGFLQPVPLNPNYSWSKTLIHSDNIDKISIDIEESEETSLDVETTSLDWTSAEMISINISTPTDNYVGFYYTGYFPDEFLKKLPSPEELDALQKLALSRKYCYMWNQFYDEMILRLRRPGFFPRDFDNTIDGLDCLFQLDSNLRFGKSLKITGQTYLGVPTMNFEDAVGEDIKTADPLNIINYGSLDGEMTLKLGQKFRAIYEKEYPFMWELMKVFTPALFEFIDTPQEFDFDYVVKIHSELQTSIENLKSEFYSKFGFSDIGSNEQKSMLLQKLGFFTGKWNKPKRDGTRYMSVAADLLEGLVKKTNCEAAQYMIDYAHLSYKVNNFTTLLKNHLMKKNATEGPSASSNIGNRFFLNRLVAPTLRMAGSSYKIKNDFLHYFTPINIQSVAQPSFTKQKCTFNPETLETELFPTEWPEGATSIQGAEGTSILKEVWEKLPIVEAGEQKLNLRNTFTVPPDYLIVEVDYSAQELRIPAAQSGEPVFVESFKNGEDLHTNVSKKIWGENAGRKDRGKAKIANFSLMYLGTYWTLMDKLKMSKTEAIQFEKEYREALPTLYSWKEDVIQKARNTGSVSTIFGWERRVKSYYDSRDSRLIGFGDRTTVNSLVQPYGAIFLRIALSKLHRILIGKGSEKYAHWYEFSAYNPKNGYIPANMNNPRGVRGEGIYYIETTHDSIAMGVPKTLTKKWAIAQKHIMESVTPKNWKELGILMKADVEVSKRLGSLVHLKPCEEDAMGLTPENFEWKLE